MDEKYIKLNRILDDALDEFTQETDEVFKTSNDRKGYMFKSASEYEKSFQKPQKCLFPECGSKSIVFSHTIQKNGGIHIIAENNHVYRPIFNEKTGKMSIESIGINKASTFPGFCKLHEGVFSVFENKKEIANDNEIKLQVFRTFCREFQTKKIELQYREKRKGEYLNLQKQRFTDVLYKHLDAEGFDKKELKDIKLDRTDYRLAYMKKEIKELQELIQVLKVKYYFPFSKDITKGSENIYYQAIKLAHLIPVGLSGAGYITYEKNNRLNKVQLLMNVIPQEDSTLIILATNKANKKILDRYISFYTQSFLMILVLIESWMIHVTDHWFIKPSVWDTLPEKRREKILSDILDIKFGVLDKYKLSIFDEVRRLMFNVIDNENNWANFNDITISFLKEERNKLIEEETYDIFPTEDILKIKGYLKE